MDTTVDINRPLLRWSDLTDSRSSLEEISFNFPLPTNETYYRSRAFVSQIGLNPLVAASAPLFFLIEQIRALKQAPNIKKLHEDFIHEINAFENQAQSCDYKSYVIHAARYVLCLWVDQTILHTTWGEKCDWKKMQLADLAETEQDSPFYTLLNHCLKEPAIYIDLLELFYLCLSLGFQVINKANSLEANIFRMAETRDYLFEIISKQRKDIATQLEIDTTEKKVKPHFTLKSLLRPGILVASCLFLTGTYAMLNHHLEATIHGAHYESNMAAI